MHLINERFNLKKFQNKYKESNGTTSAANEKNSKFIAELYTCINYTGAIYSDVGCNA